MTDAGTSISSAAQNGSGAIDNVTRKLRTQGRAAAGKLLGDDFERRRRVARRTRLRREFCDFMTEQAGGFFVEADPGPVWSRDLLMRTAVMTEEQIPGALDADRFHAVSYKQLLYHLRGLVENGLNLRTIASFFEFGCGSARLIRHMRGLEGVRLTGSDVIADSLEWCRANVPGITYEENGFDPPLTFAEDETYDVVLAHSVFTHIPLATQSAWIREIARVMRPGGFFSCTVHGRAHVDAMLDDRMREELLRTGSFELTGADEAASTSTKVTDTWDVWQTRANVIDAFRESFIVRDYRHGGQDLLILQKPPR